MLGAVQEKGERTLQQMRKGGTGDTAKARILTESSGPHTETMLPNSSFFFVSSFAPPAPICSSSTIS